MSKPKQTKTETVRAMLAQPQGASLEAICKATGWQPHSARAVLSGFRKAGYQIERSAPERGKTSGSIYRITAEPEAAE
ncbi:hypothetical protein roselon_02110 [Roseibacterium elongatum DSM 19469]|uniref:DUF3489 domain-containing protein n=1 Tax=Roseicyclus elongatus DSM 19469 TaxID=1294273 RepID=W8S2Q3_9RHOB|nr:DUF3489 domain-containing protein [Roseibacterium elongatum]AHM04457.1 hypothetical protein roselon_02110 [Roseibacterium elongatum DSM 19469]